VSRIFGGVRQNGYVVPDIEAALAHWTQVIGVGPFYYFERVPIEEFCYRGEPSPLEVSIALANSGALQIELIQQRNDAPSMYRDFLSGQPRGGLQHVAYWTQRFDADMERLLGAGFEVGQSGQIGADGRFVYFDTDARDTDARDTNAGATEARDTRVREFGPSPGSIVELSEISGAKGSFFARIAEKAAEWDGSDAIIRR
jgi:hypothetical protein